MLPFKSLSGHVNIIIRSSRFCQFERTLSEAGLDSAVIHHYRPVATDPRELALQIGRLPFKSLSGHANVVIRSRLCQFIDETFALRASASLNHNCCPVATDPRELELQIGRFLFTNFAVGLFSSWPLCAV